MRSFTTPPPERHRVTTPVELTRPRQREVTPSRAEIKLAPTPPPQMISPLPWKPVQAPSPRPLAPSPRIVPSPQMPSYAPPPPVQPAPITPEPVRPVEIQSTARPAAPPAPKPLMKETALLKLVQDQDKRCAR